MSLLNSKELAKELRVAQGYICAMKAWNPPYVMKYAGRDTLAGAMEWLEAHPDFRSTGYHRRRPLQRRKRQRESKKIQLADGHPIGKE
jgi:hypothetical protein